MRAQPLSEPLVTWKYAPLMLPFQCMCIFSSILQYRVAIHDSKTCNNIYCVYDIVIKSQQKRVLQNQSNVY